MQRFASDPTCHARARGVGSRLLSALTIQRHYLRTAEANLEANFMPPWAGELCQQWRAILDQLEQGAPDSVSTTLDWAIKLTLFKEQVHRRGQNWERLTRSLGDEAEQRMREELFELDTRFGQLDTGIFAHLDRAGVLHHGAPGVENVEPAMDRPPAGGRAQVRGDLVKRLAGCNGRYACDWEGVWDFKTKQFIDLSDPFTRSEDWQPMPEDDEMLHVDFQSRSFSRVHYQDRWLPHRTDLAQSQETHQPPQIDSALGSRIAADRDALIALLRRHLGGVWPPESTPETNANNPRG